MKKKICILITLLLSLTVFIITTNSYTQIIKRPINTIKETFQKENNRQKKRKIALCYNSKETYNQKNYSKTLTDKISKLNEYLNNEYKIAITYEEINDSFKFQKNETQTFYGASIIKAPFAISIYKQAEQNPNILNTNLKYSKSYYVAGSGIIRYNPKTEYTIKELVKVMIEESDNIAFIMLYDQFNVNKIKEKWHSLGASTTFTGYDKFGNLNSKDGALYMKELYNYLNTNTNLSKELGQYFNNASKNSVIAKSINNIIYFKYGEYSPAYHEIALVNDANPYIISILTKEYPKNYQRIIMDITKYIEDLHQTYYQEKKKFCTELYT